MIYVLIGMSLLFVGIGLLVTENNAKYLLAGYNTMSREERERFDIKSYIPAFRKFHLGLGISFLVVGVIIQYAIGEDAGAIFLAVYPSLAYIYFIWRSIRFSRVQNKGKKKPWLYISVGILISAGPLIFVAIILGTGFKESEIILSSEGIRIEGSYGEVFPPEQVASITLVDALPKLTMKTNGFAAGSIKKGYFKTSEGEIVKLILDSDNKPFLLITKKSGQKVYYSAGEKSNRELVNEMKKTLPDIIYE